MTDHPILFSAPMVRALLEGRKTQTRRLLKPQPPYEPLMGPGMFTPEIIDDDGVLATGTETWGVWTFDGEWTCKIPYRVGDRLWVREDCRAYTPVRWRGECVVRYKADVDYSRLPEGYGHWDCSPYSANDMPRWASRLTLVVTDVRVQRLHDISEADARAEGIQSVTWDGGQSFHWGVGEPYDAPGGDDPVEAFRSLWASIYGPGAWAANPWVIAISFDVHKRNIDQMAA